MVTMFVDPQSCKATERSEIVFEIEAEQSEQIEISQIERFIRMETVREQRGGPGHPGSDSSGKTTVGPGPVQRCAAAYLLGSRACAKPTEGLAILIEPMPLPSKGRKKVQQYPAARKPQRYPKAGPSRVKVLTKLPLMGTTAKPPFPYTVAKRTRPDTLSRRKQMSCPYRRPQAGTSTVLPLPVTAVTSSSEAGMKVPRMQLPQDNSTSERESMKRKETMREQQGGPGHPGSDSSRKTTAGPGPVQRCAAAYLLGSRACAKPTEGLSIMIEPMPLPSKRQKKVQQYPAARKPQRHLMAPRTQPDPTTSCTQLPRDKLVRLFSTQEKPNPPSAVCLPSWRKPHSHLMSSSTTSEREAMKREAQRQREEAAKITRNGVDCSVLADRWHYPYIWPN
ncbi:uncharacterized protein LOC114790842 isoform X3 [Denticeps clupeoides]|uniref:uncharacterized protein LOC114790842 isoform X3 n=1 Tax=Denticeps clupeoides TaxID=299321 RepID=UPI0010A3B8C4|nr:uncharacterized protein LOC114790842 isoform X3 [Denticeps clupeoides]